MKKHINIRLYADSLGLPRLNFVTNEERYINLLYDWILEKKNAEKVYLIDRSRANNLIGNLYSSFKEDNSYFDPADIIIIHEGVCDCAPRPIPNKVRNLVSRMPDILRKRIISYLHNNRATMQRNGFKFFLTKPKSFYNLYKQWLNELEGTNTQVIIFNIAPTNSMTENHSPGFTQSINNYNVIFKNLSDSIKSKNIHFINIHDIIISKDNINEYIIEEDGHHITKKGHQIYFNLLLENLTFE
jgi:acyl-CoA thioesterase I